MSSLQPEADTSIDRTSTAPFLLRLFWRQSRPLEPYEFSIAPPVDTTGISDYSSLLPSHIRQQSVQIYTWPSCTLSELTTLLTGVLPVDVLPNPAIGTRLVYKLIFPDTRAEVRDGGKGKWIDKPLGNVVIGGRDAELDGTDSVNDHRAVQDLEGDANKTLGDARFVIGDYVACSIYPPGQDGRIAPTPSARPPPMRDDYVTPPPSSRAGPPPMRNGGYASNGYGGGYGRGGGGYRGGYGGRGGGAPPPSDWRRGEPPPGYGGYGRGRGGRSYQ